MEDWERVACGRTEAQMELTQQAHALLHLPCSLRLWQFIVDMFSVILCHYFCQITLPLFRWNLGFLLHLLIVYCWETFVIFMSCVVEQRQLDLFA